ncbi:MAG TPA: hypothetical protein GXX14_04470 [Clostridiaceae bacterium]|nr:hypothetical protein [Clostridiaceae bacterium]
MDKIIQQVIKSEYKARKIVAEAHEQEKHLAENIESKIGKIKEEILAGARRKAEKIKTESLQYANAKAEEIISEANKNVSRMWVKFKENRDFWVKSLFCKILENGK